MWTTDMYRKVAAALWGAISLVIGLSIGAYFDMSEKKMLFVVVVTVGLYLIALLRWSKKREDEDGKDMKNLSSDNYKEQHKPIISVNEDENDLADNESREWLDEFLIKQQKD